ncbi:MAG: nucleoside-diphosphate sugar epimerase/dehydratase [Lentihominibacter sp.]|nr:nucleoside-diphosphate sugar epimerase/dehydratase [Lentihominibacter sp.]
MNNVNTKKQNFLHIKHWHFVTICLIAYDVLAVAASYFAALMLRFDMRYSAIPQEYLGSYIRFIPLYAVLCVIVFAAMKLYRSIWRFASYDELVRLLMATCITAVIHIVLISILFHRMPISYFMMGITLQLVFTLGVRFAYRFILLLRDKQVSQSGKVKNVMCIGGGRAGQMVVRELKTSRKMNEVPVCIIDDNPNKWGRYVEGVRVFGGRDRILEAVEKYSIEKIYFTIPSANAEVRRDILNICKESGCELKSLPGIYQIANGDVALSKMKDVDIEDLLGRDTIKVNMDGIFENIRDKVILVTGGGGSIGSELCRQIAANSPKQLIIFDIYENNAYDIQQEIKTRWPDVNLVTLIGSVRDNRRIFQVFDQYNPDIVYHAAAHKHVPLMEDSPCEAIKNNTIGTYNTAFAAMMHNCGRFVLISTDKAVNPTNCMGATKRTCEMVIQSLDYMVKNGKAEDAPQLFWNPSVKAWANTPEKRERLRRSRTEFVAVRFGNVLGSNGSVIPLFKKQILKGGPVTVTHPDIIRYFMTIPEAVSLVLEAGAYAKGGEIFVLDMGEPVKIVDLARNLIRLSGHTPDEDIKIEYTGLRPGEKLYEEKLMAEEGLEKTDNELIHIGKPIEFDHEKFLATLEPLMDAAYKNRSNIKEYLADLVSTYNLQNS